jgi:hypothetical protein
VIPTAGGDLTQLSFEMAEKQRLLHFRISPAGDRVVFDVGTRTETENAFKGNLYSNLIGAGGAADVSEAADPLFGTGPSDFFIMPDGQYVIYLYQKNAGSPVTLQSATLLGVRTPLYVPSSVNPPLTFFRLSPDSTWVMYQTSSDGVNMRLHTIAPAGGGVTNFGDGLFKLFTPDSARIAYTRVVTGENRTELFTQQIFGGAERELSGMNGAGFIGDVEISPDGKWFVFDVQVNGQYDLRVSDGAKAQPSVTPSPTVTTTVTPSPTVTITVTPSPTVTTTVTPSPTTTDTATPSPTPLETPVPGDFHSHLPAVMDREPAD